MTPPQIHTVFREACKFLTHNDLVLAFDKAKTLVRELKSEQMFDRFNDLWQDYGFLLDYFVNGTQDEDRKMRYEQIQRQLFLLVTDLREMLLTDSAIYEFSEKRHLAGREIKTSPEIFNYIKKLNQQLDIQRNSEIVQYNEIINLEIRKENFVAQLFAIFWLKTEMNADDLSVFEQIISPQYHHSAEKALLVAALTLNLWRVFSEEKLLLLLDCCQSNDPNIGQRALVGLVFVLSKYNQFLPMFPSIHNRLVVLSDQRYIVKALEIIILQIISTTQTEGITKKMHEEILPRINKIAPKIRETNDVENLLKSEDGEEQNPEWENIMGDSDLTSKFEEIAELQLEGADVYMSTFATLKHFPFFKEIANWFRPFDLNQADIMRLTATEKPDEKSLVAAMMSSSAMCNSDKYSLFLSVAQMPENQKKILFGSINADIGQLKEIENEEALLNPEKRASNLSKQYIQDLYRFFKLFPFRHDFPDMFAANRFVHKTFLFSVLIENNAHIQINTANYYLSKKLYNQAIEIFEIITAKNPTDFAAFQKLAFAYQKTENNQKAIANYLKADLIQPDDSWTLKKIALCYRVQQDFEKSLETYLHIDFLKPSIKNKFNIARCYIELEQYPEARAVYSTIEKTDDNKKLWQAIAWCAFAMGNLAEAEYYSTRCIDYNPDSLDFLHAAHIALCHSKFNTAIDFYLKTTDQTGENTESLIATIRADEKFLLKNGVNKDEMTYLTDAIRHKLN
ncbi:MAG: hypothetical protein LBS01_02115 [Prevotellaceae bacterium]|jgi:tetratricopeptide (TPR) repeat protein|nr:hypothetical protein [Prevotellaceae bacterium]